MWLLTDQKTKKKKCKIKHFLERYMCQRGRLCLCALMWKGLHRFIGSYPEISVSHLKVVNNRGMQNTVWRTSHQNGALVIRVHCWNQTKKIACRSSVVWRSEKTWAGIQRVVGLYPVEINHLMAVIFAHKCSWLTGNTCHLTKLALLNLICYNEILEI